MSSFTSSFTGQSTTPSQVKPATPCGTSSAPVLLPSANSTRATPSANASDVGRIPCVRLSPSSRVALLPTSLTPPYRFKSNSNDFEADCIPRTGTVMPTSAHISHSDRDHAAKSPQAAHPKTEVHFKAVEPKHSHQPEGGTLRMAPAAKSGATKTDTHINKATYQGVVGSLSSTTRGDSPCNKVAVAHHLQPILLPHVAPVRSASPAESSKAAGAGNPGAPLATAAHLVAAGALPTAGGAPEQRGPPRPRFSLYCIDVLNSPHGSSDSDSSSSDSSSGSNPKTGKELPMGRQQNPDGPASPGPQPLATAAVDSQHSKGTAVPAHRGSDFKDIARASVSSLSSGATDGEAAKVIRGDGPATMPGTPFTSPFSRDSPVDKAPLHFHEVQGEAVAMGRRFRHMSNGMATKMDPAAYFFIGDAPSSAIGSVDGVDGLKNTRRRQASLAKETRQRFFSPIPRLEDVLPHQKAGGLFDKRDIEKLLLPGAPCSWLCCVSLAITYVSGVPTPVESVLRANRMCVHYISLPVVTLAELFDTVNDYLHICCAATAGHRGRFSADEVEGDRGVAQYLSEDELRQLAYIHCEMATFDKEVLDSESGEDIHGMGEHPPVTSLAQFRKELLAHIGEEKSMYLFNYNPYLLEQSQLRLRSNLCDTEEDAAAVMAAARFTANMTSAFGILLNFDPVMHTVKILIPHLTAEPCPLLSREGGSAEEGGQAHGDEKEGEVHKSSSMHRFADAFASLVLEEQVVTLQAFYDSVKDVDNYLSLSHGFVRVFRSETFTPEVPSIFPLSVLDGSSAGGLMTRVLNGKIAPHLLGLAMLHHLSVTILLTDSARRKQSSRNLLKKANVCDVKLRGIPLTKVCQQLRLPLSMIVCQSNKSSIATAYVWYYCFLRNLQINNDVHIGLILASRRDGAADGQPNITDNEFLRHLQLVVQSQSVMLISFDVNVALNVRIDDRPEPAHFAIVIGVDEERGIARLGDVNVKRFRKTWHIPISRLYNAIMGYGYIVASKEKKVIKSLHGKTFHEDALQCARHFLPPPAPLKYQRFEYPPFPYPVTVLADAVERLGFKETNVEHFLNFCGFHISYFLSCAMSLEGAAIAVQKYSHYALDDAVSVQTTHYDFFEGNPPPKADAGDTGVAPVDYPVRSEGDLLQAILYAIAMPEKRKLIIKYGVRVLQANVGVWNGNYGGSFAFVMGYEAPTKMVVLSDASPSSFYRTFACPLALLFEAVCSWDSVDLRACGTILLTTETTQEMMYEDTRGYDMAHALVHHPFKPIFSAACSCLALASTEMMMNISIPTLLGGTGPNKSGEEGKKTYKRYSNIFSAEDFLYALPSFNVREWRTRSVDIKELVSMASNAFEVLGLPLRVVDVLQEGGSDCCADPTALLRACGGVEGLVTVTLFAYDTGVVHGVPGLSVGLVNRVQFVSDEDYGDAAKAKLKEQGAPTDSVGSVQLLEGDPCRWGACFERTAEELVRALKGLYRIEELIND